MTDSTAHLLTAVAAMESRVRALVQARRRDDPNPDDAFRGLYVADDHVDRLLSVATGPTAYDTASPDIELSHTGLPDIGLPDGGAGSRLTQAKTAFGLTDLDVWLLLCALAPDLDPRFEKLYGYLHDDLTRRRASPGLALQLAGRSGMDVPARERLLPGGPLCTGGLLMIEETDRPFLTRSLRVPDRVASHLLGGDACEAIVMPYRAHPIPWPHPTSVSIGRAVAAGISLTYLRQSGSATAMPVAYAGLLGCWAAGHCATPVFRPLRRRAAGSRRDRASRGA